MSAGLLPAGFAVLAAAGRDRAIAEAAMRARRCMLNVLAIVAAPA